MSNLPQRHAQLTAFVRELYGSEGFIPLHSPVFLGREKEYLNDCVDSTFVSSVGAYVDRFEGLMREITGARYAIATMNGTAALHLSLVLAGVGRDDEVITQPLSFVATCNAIAYQQAHPVFVDVDKDTLSLSPSALEQFLTENTEVREHGTFNRTTGRRIAAVVPMHSFGLPGRIEALAQVCARWGLVLIEDAAESLGSLVGSTHTGRFARIGAFSFNGNKIVTSGGGGCIITDDPELGKLAKHLSTTAKQPHPWEFFHDQVGYNYRMPNINAALACAQLEQLEIFLSNKRETAARYRAFCLENDWQFVDELPGSRSNFWLNAILMTDRVERDLFLKTSNDAGVMVRPIWTLMQRLPAFQGAQCGPLPNAEWLEDRVINIPSSFRQ